MLQTKTIAKNLLVISALVALAGCGKAPENNTALKNDVQVQQEANSMEKKADQMLENTNSTIDVEAVPTSEEVAAMSEESQKALTKANLEMEEAIKAAEEADRNAAQPVETVPAPMDNSQTEQVQ